VTKHVIIFLLTISTSWGAIVNCTYSNKSIKLQIPKDKSFIKVVKDRGCVYTYSINNTNNLSYVDDYVEIKDSKSHNIVYPLKCEEGL